MWRSKNQLDGIREYLIYDDCLPHLFHSRKEAKEYITRKYGYIAHRPDLKAEPHGWRMPIPVRVSVKVEGVAK